MSFRKLIFSPDATEHIQSIEAAQGKAPKAMRRLLRRLAGRLASLEMFPRQAPHSKRGRRRMTVLTHTVVYRLTDDTIEVVAILPSKADRALSRFERD